jgi:hypothetical protein
LGSARVSRVNASPARTFGVAPKQAFRQIQNSEPDHALRESRDGEDAIGPSRTGVCTRDGCATQRKEDTLEHHAS